MKTPYDAIFDELRFSEEERKVFMESIGEIKRVQDGDAGASANIVPIVRKLVKDEVQ